MALRLMDRGSTISAGMFVKDHEAVRQAFAVGVGNRFGMEERVKNILLIGDNVRLCL